ncbi:hypothetical protein [Aquipseudomonas campi]
MINVTFSGLRERLQTLDHLEREHSRMAAEVWRIGHADTIFATLRDAWMHCAG